MWRKSILFRLCLIRVTECRAFSSCCGTSIPCNTMQPSFPATTSSRQEEAFQFRIWNRRNGNSNLNVNNWRTYVTLVACSVSSPSCSCLPYRIYFRYGDSVSVLRVGERFARREFMYSERMTHDGQHQQSNGSDARCSGNFIDLYYTISLLTWDDDFLLNWIY